ncbi:MAG: hypothetical protein M1827_003912 [Pycnora praestabilis]|nr:MAG: hypothetical protein M1827_003912 [Pycnora praestabilis]
MLPAATLPPPSPTPSNASLKSAQTKSTAAHASRALLAHSSDLVVFLTNLRLLGLDHRSDWPSISTHTFSTKEPGQSQRTRIRCVEWVLYRLFEIWNVEETQNKLRPFFPPLEPLQSLNLRAALYRCLNELKKVGALGREIVLRKTMLDECKGGKFEELLMVFSNVVLKRVVLAEQQKDHSTTRRLALTGRLTIQDQSSMVPLAIAHKKSLVKVLKEKRDLKTRYEHFSNLLTTRLKQMKERNEELGVGAHSMDQQSDVETEEAEALRKVLREDWLGDPQWVDVILQGDRKDNLDMVLTAKFPAVWETVTNGDIWNFETKVEKGLLEDLDHRVRAQHLRLKRWSEFRHDFAKHTSAPANPSKISSRVEQGPSDVWPNFQAHKNLSLRHRNPDIYGHEEVPSMEREEDTSARQDCRRLMKAMHGELERACRSTNRGGRGWRTTSTSSLLSTDQEQVASPAERARRAIGTVSHMDKPDTDRIMHAISPGDVDSHSRDQNTPLSPDFESEDDQAVSSGDERAIGTRDEGQADERRERNALGTASSNLKSVPSSGNFIPRMESQMLPPHSPQIGLGNAPISPIDFGEQTQLAEQIISSVITSEPSPTKARPSLLERTRMSMAFFSNDDIRLPLVEESPRSTIDQFNISSVARKDTTSSRTTLLERTRQSMSLVPTTSHRPAQSKPRKSLYPVNQFETPQKQHVPDGDSKDSTPREELFSREADYASVFKSRPKIALSPSSFGVTRGEGLGEENEDDGLAGRLNDGMIEWASSPLMRPRGRIS